MANVAQLLVEKNGFADRIQVSIELQYHLAGAAADALSCAMTGYQGANGRGGAAREGGHHRERVDGVLPAARVHVRLSALRARQVAQRGRAGVPLALAHLPGACQPRQLLRRTVRPRALRITRTP